MIVLAALLVALATWLWVSPVPRWSTRRQAPELPTVLRPRPGAPALPRRLMVSLPAAGGGWLVLGARPELAPVALAAGVMAAVGLGLLEPSASRHRRGELVQQVPEALELMAAALEAGAPLRGAVTTVAALAPPSAQADLRAVTARIGVGFSDVEAWAVLLDDPTWAPVAQDLARSADTGAAAAQLLRQHAIDIRRRREDDLTRQARAVGVRSVLPLMACFLPAFVLVGVVPIVAGLVGDYLNR
ncbi:type II secretion system F family protein [Luteococcus peritonei]|uniref:Type II secretion system F family protein n=1 Tax=Luteococcus peritonei TaxID=88874 RepID=A0ABW4RUT4_9ACTN